MTKQYRSSNYAFMQVLLENLAAYGLVILSSLLFSSCDFTPPLRKDILKAQEYIQEQNYQQAVRIYKNILKKKPNRKLKIKILYQLGDIYSIYLNENYKAIDKYKEVIKISKDPLWLVKTEERLGDIYYNYTKNYLESAKVYKKLSSFNPPLKRNDYYYFHYAMSLLNLKKYQAAKKAFSEISLDKKNGYYKRSFFYIALSHFERKEWKEAIYYLETYLKLEKRTDYLAEAKYLMANSYESIENLKSAYNIYYSILGEYPNTEVIQNRLKAIYDRRVARKR